MYTSKYKHPNSTHSDHVLHLNSNDLMKSTSLTIDIDDKDDDPICNSISLECKPIYICVESNISSSSSTDVSNDLELTYNIMVTQNTIGILSDGITTQSILTPSFTQKLFKFTIDKTSVNTLMIN